MWKHSGKNFLRRDRQLKQKPFYYQTKRNRYSSGLSFSRSQPLSWCICVCLSCYWCITGSKTHFIFQMYMYLSEKPYTLHLSEWFLDICELPYDWWIFISNLTYSMHVSERIKYQKEKVIQIILNLWLQNCKKLYPWNWKK
jgi:hypothetical protein